MPFTLNSLPQRGTRFSRLEIQSKTVLTRPLAFCQTHVKQSIAPIRRENCFICEILEIWWDHAMDNECAQWLAKRIVSHEQHLELVDQAFARELAKPLIKRQRGYITFLHRERSVYSFAKVELETALAKLRDEV